MVDVNVRKFRSYEFNVSPCPLEFLKKIGVVVMAAFRRRIFQIVSAVWTLRIFLKENVGKASTQLRFFNFGFIQI